ncbi:TetR/AcrR family transcriptional regulator [Eubacteriaceae bacterium ES3]|nr:TetR/AcrR family transcriptional regulator [Eubacteriaceae bacterium ES3]
MPPKPKTPEEIEIEKKKILKVALNIISEQGYNNLTMRLVASRCGISATKIYYYFTNKEEIYFNIVEYGFALLHQEIKDAYCEGSNPLDRFKKVCRAFIHFATENANYYEIMLSARTPRRLDYVGSELEEIAEREKEVGIHFYEFWSKCVSELADYQGVEANEYDIVSFFALLHGIINLEHSNNLREIDIAFETLSELVIDKMAVFLKADLSVVK